MAKKKLGAFLKILIFLFLLSVIICLVGRNYFLTGTALIMFRWLIVFVGGMFLFILNKREGVQKIKIAVLSTLLAVLLDFGLIKWRQASIDPIEQGKAVTLMSYNLLFSNANHQNSLKQAVDLDPDILIVQELTPKWKQSMDHALGHRYPFQKAYPLKHAFGIGIYSKYKISDVKILKNIGGLPFALIAELRIHEKDVQLINVHLSSPAVAVENPDRFLSLYIANYKQRRRQLTQLASHISPNADAQILTGDLNTTHYEPIYRDLKNDWVDLFSSVGSGSRFSFPNTTETQPLFTLDYIFVRGRLKAKEARVISGGHSDHLAIWGRIEI